MKTLTLHFSENLIRSAVFSFWCRTLGWVYPAAILLLGAATVALIALGDRSWYLGIFGTVLVLALTFAAALYATHRRDSLGRFRRMKSPQATLELFEEHLRVTSDVGSSEMIWKAVCDLWCFSNYWLLFFNRAQFITLPLEDLDDEARRFIIEKVQAHGGKVR